MTKSQAIVVQQSFLPLFNRSWTFEAWIYIPNLQSSIEYPVAGQCQSLVTDQCLHLLVKNARLHVGFYNDGLTGTKSLTSSRWYHSAFVFNDTTGRQYVYLDGVLDSSRRSNHCYQGIQGSLTIGKSEVRNPVIWFDGLIDQFTYINRSKSSQEILRDATLTLHISFDGNSTLDEGPLGIHGSLAGSTSFLSGRQGQALQIFDVPDSYLAVQGLVLLGRVNQSYSFSIWIKPTVMRKSSIIHMSELADGTGWCAPMIGMCNSSQPITFSFETNIVEVKGSSITINSWTHIAATYSLTNGLRLYINGSLYNASTPFSFIAAGLPTHLIIGSPRNGTNCGGPSGTNGQYVGAVDELRVYSRELNSTDVLSLANLGP